MRNLIDKLQQRTQGFHWHNFSWQSVNYGASGVLLIVFYIILARLWTQSQFGQLSTVMVWMAVYSLVAELGLDFWATRQTSLDKTKAYPLNLVWFKFISAVLIGLAFILLAYLQGLPLLAFTVFTVGAITLNITHFFSCYLRGSEKLSIEAKLSALRMLLFFGLGLIGVNYGYGLMWVACCYTGASIFMAIGTAFAIRANGFALSHQPLSLLTPIKTAFYVWICALLLGLSLKIDILILGFLMAEEEVAIFTAASRFYEGGQLLTTAFVLTIFPKLTQHFAESRHNYLSLVLSHCKLLSMLVIAAAVMGIIFGKTIFVMLFGESYRASVPVFVMLMILLPLSALITYLYQALIIAGRTKSVVLLFIAGVTFSLVFDYLLIPIWQIDGLMLSYAVKESLMLLGMVWLVYRLNSDLKHEKAMENRCEA